MPTNLDLAAEAETIVVARVDGERTAADPFDGSVLATPVALLKGTVLPPRITITEAGLSDDPRMVYRSAPRELRAPNEGALIGGCVRYVFAKGMQLVLFLHRDATGALVPFRSPFARDAEDVAGPDALWAKAVREYGRIGALPRRERRAALTARMAQLRATGNADDSAIAADMAVELSGERTPSAD